MGDSDILKKVERQKWFAINAINTIKELKKASGDEALKVDKYLEEILKEIEKLITKKKSKIKENKEE